ncbi:putative Metallo-beta-lactamase family protein [Candidatus Promineifilum breve]|uniref:Metallo-beta-lactamase family protein n=1 Tax=Candidatus Promineifilum breve TaxID=1806508 RepID=A0A161KAH8_9CHLR|nr:MBL fold metallo-hydrolase [Candidatus Promineifilum breve]CUS03283.2 putative Metallo-beta-lactamase family protein [Candidatus Promineifilum breve]
MEPIRLELPTGWAMGPVNAYLFTQPEIILVDAGLKTADCWAALVDGLAAQGVAVGDIARVVITHPHVDHYGLAGRIVAESDATVWIYEAGAPWLSATGGMWAARHAYYRDTFLPRLGLPPATAEMTLAGLRGLASLADPVPDERVVTFHPGGRLQMGGQAWDIHHAPGHAGTQTIFHQPETRRLLSADMLLAVTPTPVIEHPPPGQSRRSPSLPLFLDSLDRVEALDVAMVYPGHGRPFGDPRRVINRQRERIRSRKAECLALIRAGRTTVPDLLDGMYAHQPPESRLAGLWMLVGYLDLLLAEGAVDEAEVDGVGHYRIKK